MQHDNLKDALRVCQHSLVAVLVFSAVTNLLMLVPAFFMLNVYDKAVAFQSLPTLWVLSGITLFLFVMMALMDMLRGWMLVHISTRLDKELSPSVFDETFHNAVRLGPDSTTVQPLTDLTNLRQFLTGQGVIAVCDAPWLPFYLIILFLFHPLLGWLGVGAALVFLALAVANQLKNTTHLQQANEYNRTNAAVTHRQLRNSEVVAAMGMLPKLRETWRARQDLALEAQERASVGASTFSALIKTIRLAAQSAAIAAGAYLVLKQEISPGMLIAGSILIGRALQPVESAIGAWSGFIAAKGQYDRLNKLMSNAHAAVDRMEMPKIDGALSLRGAALAAPAGRRPIVSGITCAIPAGSVCMVVGPSGAGKSTLVRGLLGLWNTIAGEIRIDGLEAGNYDRIALGEQIGYLPQDIELFEGTVAANIARFDEIDSAAVIQAATEASIHDFILTLPSGYDTMIGGARGHLSPGQCQRLALARALYREPKLLVLDEPNSNLDEEGEIALENAIKLCKQRHTTVVIVSHRTKILSLSDYVLVLNAGRQADFGATTDVLARLQGSEKTRAPTALPASKTVPITRPVT